MNSSFNFRKFVNKKVSPQLKRIADAPLHLKDSFYLFFKGDKEEQSGTDPITTDRVSVPRQNPSSDSNVSKNVRGGKIHSEANVLKRRGSVFDLEEDDFFILDEYLEYDLTRVSEPSLLFLLALLFYGRFSVLSSLFLATLLFYLLKLALDAPVAITEVWRAGEGEEKEKVKVPRGSMSSPLPLSESHPLEDRGTNKPLG